MRTAWFGCLFLLAIEFITSGSLRAQCPDSYPSGEKVWPPNAQPTPGQVIKLEYHAQTDTPIRLNIFTKKTGARLFEYMESLTRGSPPTTSHGLAELLDITSRYAPEGIGDTCGTRMSPKAERL